MSSGEKPIYRIARIERGNMVNCDWDHAIWTQAETLEITSFRSESSAHRPRTFVRLVHDGKSILGIFRVEDRFVRCVRTEYQSEVWKDSCVEFFVRPVPGALPSPRHKEPGYFNFEFNCGGAFLCCYITDPARTKEGFKEFTRVPKDLASSVQVRSSLTGPVDPEIAEPLTWTLGFRIPVSLLEIYTGELGQLSGQTWTGNFFKCAEEVSHPHWASWSPVDEFNFHLPRCFGTVQFQ